MTKSIKEFSGVGGIGGFQLPIGGADDKKNKKKKKKKKNENITPEEIKALREFIRGKIKEIVRKKEGGAGYVLYAPNKGKKHKAKDVGTFPTKIQAKAAELQRFPPRDPDTLQKKRKQIDKVRKDPKKAADKERQERIASKKRGKHRKESIHRAVHSALIESFSAKEDTGNRWEEHIGKLSKEAVLADKKLQGLSKNIAKKSEAALKNTIKRVGEGLKTTGFNVDSKGVRKDENKGSVFNEFNVTDEDGGKAGPFYVSIENGRPRVEIGEDARASMGKWMPEKARNLRGSLAMMQEQEFDKDDTVVSAIGKRDAYLDKLEGVLDKKVSDMSPLEITILKKLLVSKYRKIG